MAKQTFTTGQVLTAAQMTSLQQTAMGGGAATAKTASYVLVAGDAGGTVAMSAAGATTITVNTGLFAAGDTVFIQNLGVGACTVTAGTATVATAGSLILPQNDAGILYFTSASAAIFYDYIQVGAASPLTTKGDLYTFSTSDDRLGVGANGTTLVADSAEATGLKWATPASGGMTLLSTSTLTGTTFTISSIPSGFKKLIMFVKNPTQSSTGDIFWRMNGLSTNIYSASQDASPSAAKTYSLSSMTAIGNPATTPQTGGYTIEIFDYLSTTTTKSVRFSGGYTAQAGGSNVLLVNGVFAVNTLLAVTSFTFGTLSSAPGFNGGTVELYGVK